ncbi:hypothetical protein ACU5P1_04125 [Pseudomonas plecoglossicida]|uniref:Uncharacterized protein n=1 Tax=Pseudomonas plecoglossicida TaxID=70775 RepID=A0AAD0QY99_PSEDL|nr:hypothetical protein [Pseudomonas plecoglossicida]AXM97913.1 hypothetical protein DVB73_20080 [Pseudomonas plecoglossicida]EPB94938.1 hypothetical protein L321_15366 [Pseudomonas plecoglossicida NB2011]QLB54054.1 hypothetical protein HAV28_04095 [Pseudomonas plecoglossicida]GLR38947.1 hypothetical protein GCM10011247_43460 [Pseudomonas plecoglossicida]
MPSQAIRTYDQIFYTTWGDDNVVSYSRTLVEMLTEAVLDSERPSLGSQGGLFKTRGLASIDQHLKIDLNLINEAITIVYRHIKQTEQEG